MSELKGHGTAILEILIDDRGAVAGVAVLRSVGKDADALIIAALTRYAFTPTLIGEVAVAVHVLVAVDIDARRLEIGAPLQMPRQR